MFCQVAVFFSLQFEHWTLHNKPYTRTIRFKVVTWQCYSFYDCSSNHRHGFVTWKRIEQTPKKIPNDPRIIVFQTKHVLRQKLTICFVQIYIFQNFFLYFHSNDLISIGNNVNVSIKKTLYQNFTCLEFTVVVFLLST